MTPETPRGPASFFSEPPPPSGDGGAVPTTPGPRPPAEADAAPAATSRRGLWILLGAVLLLAGGAAGVWWWLRTGAPPVPATPADVEDLKVREAIENARRKVLDDLGSGDAWGGLGMTLLAHLCFEEADRCFAEAARLDPANARWTYFRYTIATRLDPTHALPLLRQAAATGSPVPEEQSTLQLQLADTLLEDGQLEEAAQLYREQLRVQPNNPRASFGLGVIAAARDDERTAVNFLTTAQASPQARKKATAQLAQLARARGDAAAADYEKEAASLPNDQDWPDPFFKAMFKYRVGQAQERHEVGLLERAGRFEEAAEVHLSRIEREPTAVDHYIGAGYDLARAGDYDRALALLREAVRLDPDNSGTHYRLAQTLFQAAEEEEKRSAESRRARAWFREAAGAAQRAAQRKPDRADAYLIWGRSLMRLGEPAAAIDPLQKGVACRPELFGLQLALGEALLESGRPTEAETHLENAQKLDANDARLVQALERLRKKKG